jgi:hypothetical protein
MDVFIAAVLLIGAGVVSLALPPVRNLVLRRFGGWVYAQVTEEGRRERAVDAERADERKANDEERRRVRRSVLEAVGVLEEGLTMGLGNWEGALKIQQAVSALELHGPADVQGQLQNVIAQSQQYVEGMPVNVQRELMRPITAAVRRWAEQ